MELPFPRLETTQKTQNSQNELNLARIAWQCSSPPCHSSKTQKLGKQGYVAWRSVRAAKRFLAETQKSGTNHMCRLAGLQRRQTVSGNFQKLKQNWWIYKNHRLHIQFILCVI